MDKYLIRQLKHLAHWNGDQTCLIPFGHSVQRQHVSVDNKQCLTVFGLQIFSVRTGAKSGFNNNELDNPNDQGSKLGTALTL